MAHHVTDSYYAYRVKLVALGSGTNYFEVYDNTQGYSGDGANDSSGSPIFFEVREGRLVQARVTLIQLSMSHTQEITTQILSLELTR